MGESGRGAGRIAIADQIVIALVGAEDPASRDWMGDDPFALCLLTFAREAGERRAAMARRGEGEWRWGEARERARGEIAPLAAKALERARELGLWAEDGFADLEGQDPEPLEWEGARDRGAAGFWMEAAVACQAGRGGWRERAAERLRAALEELASEEGIGAVAEIHGWGDLEGRYPGRSDEQMASEALDRHRALRESREIEGASAPGRGGGGGRRL